MWSMDAPGCACMPCLQTTSPLKVNDATHSNDGPNREAIDGTTIHSTNRKTDELPNERTDYANPHADKQTDTA